MMRFWQSLNQREQVLFVIMSALMLAVLLYFSVITPLRDYARKADQEYARSLRVYEAVVAGAARVEAAKKSVVGSQAVETEGSVRLKISKAARDADIAISRIQPDASQSLTVWVDGASAQALYQWLYALENQYGLSPMKVSLQKTGTDGLVRAQLQFSGALE